MTCLTCTCRITDLTIPETIGTTQGCENDAEEPGDRPSGLAANCNFGGGKCCNSKEHISEGNDKSAEINCVRYAYVLANRS